MANGLNCVMGLSVQRQQALYRQLQGPGSFKTHRHHQPYVDMCLICIIVLAILILYDIMFNQKIWGVQSWVG